MKFSLPYTPCQELEKYTQAKLLSQGFNFSMTMFTSPNSDNVSSVEQLSQNHGLVHDFHESCLLNLFLSVCCWHGPPASPHEVSKTLQSAPVLNIVCAGVGCSRHRVCGFVSDCTADCQTETNHLAVVVIAYSRANFSVALRADSTITKIHC